MFESIRNEALLNVASNDFGVFEDLTKVTSLHATSPDNTSAIRLERSASSLAFCCA